MPDDSNWYSALPLAPTDTQAPGFNRRSAPSPGGGIEASAPDAVTPAPSSPSSDDWYKALPLAPDQSLAQQPASKPSNSPESVTPSAHLGPLSGAANAFNAFTEQAMRSGSMGLSDKIGAAVPALNEAVKRGWTTATQELGAENGGAPASTDEANTPPQQALGDIYQQGLQQNRAAGETYAENHPVASKVASTLGAVGTLAPAAAGAMAPASLGGKVWQGVKGGAGFGALAGFGQSNDQSVGQDVLNTGLGATAGAVTGGATAAASDLVLQPVINWAARKLGPGAVESQGAQLVFDTMRKDVAGGKGVTAQNMLDLLNAAPNKPQALADVGGANTKALGGRLARAPGESRQIIEGMLNERDVGAGTRLASDVDTGISSGPSAYDTQEALLQARSAAARQPYDEAMAGGSIAPLQDQLRNSVQTATAAKGTIQKQLTAIEQNNPGALAARGAAGSKVRAQYVDLTKQLQQAEADRQATLGIFQKAQSDATSNAPGAVWNPRIAQLMQNPDVKKGIPLGLKILRNEADARGVAFNPTEYAITGHDAAGEPIVGNVPNMRLLDAAKKGLDSIIGNERNEVTGRLSQYGRSVEMLRQSFVDELDKANPAYAAARASWSGPSQSMDALRMGQTIFGKKPPQIAAEFARLQPGDQEFYKLGAADALKEKISRTGMGGDEAKRIIGNDWTQKQIRPLFSSQRDYRSFIDAVTVENRMFQTRQATIGGSDTARRVAEDAEHGGAMGDLGRGALAIAEGAHGAGALSLVKAAREYMNRQNPDVAAAASRMLFNPNLGANQSALARFAAAANAPSRLPLLTTPLAQIAGRNPVPVLGSIPYAGSVMGGESGR